MANVCGVAIWWRRDHKPDATTQWQLEPWGVSKSLVSLRVVGLAADCDFLCPSAQPAQLTPDERSVLFYSSAGTAELPYSPGLLNF